MSRDVHADLLAWLVERGGPGCHAIDSVAHPWASATFAGQRHRMTLLVDDEQSARFREGLDEADLPLRGHLLADIAILGCAGPRLAIEALTIEEG